MNSSAVLTVVSTFLALLVSSLLPNGAVARTTDDNFLLQVVTQRSLEEIQSDISRTQVALRIANDRELQARSILTSLEDRIGAKEKAIDTLSSAAKAARKAKSANAVTLKAEKEAVEQVRDLLKRRRELRKTEIDVARAEGEAAQAQIHAFALEMELLNKRIEREAALYAGGDPTLLHTLAKTIQTVEGECLKAQKAAIEKAVALSKEQKKLIEQRVKLFELQKLSMTSTALGRLQARVLAERGNANVTSS